jgi:nucleoid DNA-binding protein
MSDTVHQGQITREAAAAEGLSQRVLKDAAKQILTLIKEALLRDGHVRIHNFGTFRLRWVKAHRGVNPQTGEPVLVPAHPRALFAPAKALREAVESARDQTPRSRSLPHAEPVPPLGVAASRLRTPTMVKRARADAPSEGQGGSGPPEPMGAHEEPEERSDARGRPWMALAIVAVVALLALLVFWPRDHEERQVVEAPLPDTIEQSPASTGSTAQPHGDEDDLSVTSTQSDQAMRQVVTASSGTENALTPAPALRGSSESAEGEWLLQAIDHPVRRSDDESGPQTMTARAEPAATLPQSRQGAQTASASSRPTPAGPFFVGRDYQIAWGDNLWNLSGEHYVHPYYWPHIYNANQDRIRNPNLIRSGSHIRLPTLYGHPDQLTGDDRRSIAEGYFLLYRLFKRRSDPDAVFALSAVSHFDKAVIQEHEAEIRASHSLEVELAETYGMRIGNRIFLAHGNVHFPTRLFD